MSGGGKGGGGRGASRLLFARTRIDKMPVGKNIFYCPTKLQVIKKCGHVFLSIAYFDAKIILDRAARSKEKKGGEKRKDKMSML